MFALDKDDLWRWLLGDVGGIHAKEASIGLSWALGHFSVST
jgi:hypothetical protein